MTNDRESAEGDKPRVGFRVTLVRVLAVQIVTLLLLWWMQTYYST